MIVSAQYNKIKIVEMPKQIVATVRTSWSISSAPSKAFWSLAWYIFWDNRSSDKIAMTAPVVSQSVESEKIAMTAPVTSKELKNWTYETSFTMPSKRTMETLPIPNNKNVTLKEIVWSKKAVWTFDWYANKNEVAKQRDLFLLELETNSIKRSGNPTLAQYNDPRTPPRMRRNELWVDVSN